MSKVYMKKLMVSVLIAGLCFNAGLAQAHPDKEKSLPPGLQKKLERGGELPPGWQKKLVVGEYLEDKVYRSGRVIGWDGGLDETTIEVEGRVVRVIEATREIIDILK